MASPAFSDRARPAVAACESYRTTAHFCISVAGAVGLARSATVSAWEPVGLVAGIAVSIGREVLSHDRGSTIERPNQSIPCVRIWVYS